MLERFGIKGVSLDNLEQIYNPLNSGFGSLHATRTHLIQRGMTSDLADSLAKRYLNRLEQSSTTHIVSLMDLFNSSTSATALNALLKANLSTDVHFAYQTWDEYLQTLAEKQVYSALQRGANTTTRTTTAAQRIGGGAPVRPAMVQMAQMRGIYTSGVTRGFSTQQGKDKEKIIYTEEYLQRQEKEKTQKTGGKFFEFIQKIDKLDATPSKSETAGAKNDYDLSELDISFEKISRPQDIVNAQK